MKSNMYFILAFIGLGMTMVSCSDDDAADATVMITPQLSVEMVVAEQAVTAGETFDINGTALQVNVAQFYIGNLNFIGEQNFAQEDYFIAAIDQNSFSLPEIEEGSYDFQFGIGVTPEINSLEEEDFTTRPTGDPLGVQNPSMHWSWNSGYKFLRIDGMVDTDADGVPDQAIEYHLGSNNFFALLNAPQKLDLTEENNTITIRFDLEEFLKEVDLSNGQVTHVMDNKPMADQLFINYPSAFSISL